MNKKYIRPLITLYLAQITTGLLINTPLYTQESEHEYKLKTVIIDPGHGGKDPGSLGRQSTEKEIVLAIALKAGKYIEENLPGVRVIYTRTKDEFVPLHERAEIANSNKADLFISIHANGNDNKQVTGTESLVLGLHRADENFEVAKKENSVILLEDDYTTKYEGFDPNVPESYIIFSLMQNLYFEQSINFAGLVQEQFRDRTQRKDRGVKQQGLLVLARTSMPGILVETGFITSRDEEIFLLSDQGQDFIASAIYRAFKNYKNLIETKTSFAMASKFEKLSADTVPPRLESNSLNETKGEISERKHDSISYPVVEFKVQVIASSKPLSPGSHVFKGLSSVTEYRAGNMYKYAVGSNRTFQEAVIYSKQVKERFPDAFIIAIRDNKIIPLDQALIEPQIINSKK